MKIVGFLKQMMFVVLASFILTLHVFAENGVTLSVPVTVYDMASIETTAVLTMSEIKILTSDADTNGAKYSIKQAIVKNSDNVTVHNCPSNGRLESVTLVKHTSETVPAKLIAALYHDSILEKAQTVSIRGNGAENSEIICDVNLSFGTMTDAHYVKIMVWEDTSTLKPFVTPYNTSVVCNNRLCL